jgi:hypothetical protein
MPSFVPVGLDFAPSSSGVVLGSTAATLSFEIVVWEPSPDGVKKSWRERREAAGKVAGTIESLVWGCGYVPFVLIEDFAPGKFAGPSHIEISESRGYLLTQFVNRGWPFALIHPMRLKSFAKVKTKADTTLQAQVNMKTMGCPPLPEGLTKRQLGDICDAFVLWQIGMEVLFHQDHLPVAWVTGDSALGLPRNSYYEPFLEG